MSNPSVFAGWYKAANFAYGSPGGPSALFLQQATPTLATSPATALPVTTAHGYTTTTDGITFYPLNTNAPVQVGGDSNAEEVTPSTVSAPSPIYQQVTFTAEFENDHGSGDAVASATFGAQEAANYAAAQGGGIVVVDAEWTRLGGTDAIYNALTLPSGVTKLDQRP